MAKSALDAPRGATTFRMDPDEPIIIGLDTKHTRRGAETKETHPLWDERADGAVDESLVLNVMRFNVKVPILVIKDGAKVIVVDGRQRLKAARIANTRIRKAGGEALLVPIMIDQKTSDGLSGHYATMILLNEFRRADTPLVRARKVADYLSLGKTTDEAAVVLGVSAATVNNLIKLLELAPEVQRAVDERKLSAFAAMPLADLTQEQQRTKLVELMTESQESHESYGDAVTRPVSPLSRRAVERKVGRESTISLTPSRTEIKRLLAACEEEIPDGLDVDESFLRGVRWARGELPGSKVKGLLAVITKKPPPRESTEPGKPPKKKGKGRGKKK